MNQELQNLPISELKTNKGQKGELGKGSPGKRLKELWKTKGAKGQSLRAFVKSLKDNTDVKNWFANKAGENEKERSEVNAALAKTCASATMQGRRKKKGDAK